MFSEKYGTEVGGITTQSRITERTLLQKEFLTFYFDECCVRFWPKICTYRRYLYQGTLETKGMVSHCRQSTSKYPYLALCMYQLIKQREGTQGHPLWCTDNKKREMFQKQQGTWKGCKVIYEEGIPQNRENSQRFLVIFLCFCVCDILYLLKLVMNHQEKTLYSLDKPKFEFSNLCFFKDH